MRLLFIGEFKRVWIDKYNDEINVILLQSNLITIKLIKFDYLLILFIRDNNNYNQSFKSNLLIYSNNINPLNLRICTPHKKEF
jgi:hypothetical protein